MERVEHHIRAQRIEARVDGVPIFECSYGTHHGQVALRVEKLLPPEKDTLAP